jgi:hypothetical protein
MCVFYGLSYVLFERENPWVVERKFDVHQDKVSYLLPQHWNKWGLLEPID